MRKLHTSDGLFFAFTLVVSVLYWLGVSAVPFHPDEATYLFASRDIETLIKNPDDLIYQSGAPFSQFQRLHMIDAPLTRYLVEAARSLASQPALVVDWDWSLTWEQNQAAGALPSEGQLTAARFGPAALFPFSLVLMYLTGIRLGGRPTGWIAAVLLACNALVLLHTRRAMAESALLFTTLLSLFLILSMNRRRWLLAIPVGLAFCAKQSAVGLILVAAAAVIWPPSGEKFNWRKSALHLAFYGLLLVGIYFVLNPFLWRTPITAFDKSIELRSELNERMIADQERLLPAADLKNICTRSLIDLQHLYFTPPAFSDVSNYTDETAASETAYMINPLHNILRSSVSGTLLLILTLLGIGLAVMEIRRCSAARRRTLALVITAAVILPLSLVLALGLPFQRYLILLVPVTCLWEGFALSYALPNFRGRP